MGRITSIALLGIALGGLGCSRCGGMRCGPQYYAGPPNPCTIEHMRLPGHFVFEPGSTELDERGSAAVAEVMRIAHEERVYLIRLDGHGDGCGDEGQMATLAVRRIETVDRVLHQAGIGPHGVESFTEPHELFVPCNPARMTPRMVDVSIAVQRPLRGHALEECRPPPPILATEIATDDSPSP